MKHIQHFLIIAMALVIGFLAITAIGGQAAKAETAEPAPAQKGVSFRTSGTGRVFVEPDIAYLTVGATGERDTAADAMADVNKIMDAVLAAIRGAGIEEKDIKTSYISIDINYDYSGPVRTMKGYVARNSVALTIRDLAKVAEILDAVIKAGANDVGSLSFDKENKQAAYDEAMTLAVTRANEKIKVLHEASGVGGTLKAVRFDELGVNYYAPNARQMDMAAAKEASGGVSVIPGNIEVVAEVAVEYVAGE